MTKRTHNAQPWVVRVSLSLKFGLLSALLVLLVAGVTTYVLVYRFGQERAQELVGQDRELARVLAGLRNDGDRLDFDTLASIVGSADKADLGLVYALELDPSGRLRRGALNPRMFARLDDDYRALVLKGRRRVLEALVAEKVQREGRVKEYTMTVPRGTLRLGFNLRRIDAQIGQQTRAGGVILGAGLLLGVLAALGLARNLTRPIRRLAGAMEAVARGDMNQTVEVNSRDELASLAGSFNQMMRALRDVRHVRMITAGYLGNAIFQRVLAEDSALELATEERAVTVMVISLRGLTATTGRASARANLGLVNEYWAPVLDAVLSQQGVVFMLGPTRLQAVWGAPTDVVDPELKALRAAQAARNAAVAEARRQSVVGFAPLQLTAGVCTGRAAVGNVGSAHRHSYAVVGEPADFAEAVEAMAEPSQVLVAEATYAKVGDRVRASACVPLMVDGLDEAIPLYRLEAT